MPAMGALLDEPRTFLSEHAFVLLGLVVSLCAVMAVLAWREWRGRRHLRRRLDSAQSALSDLRQRDPLTTAG